MDATLRKLLDSLPDALVVVAAGGRIVRVNAPAERLFGYSRRQLTGRSVEHLVPEACREAHKGLCREYSASPRVRPMGSGKLLSARRSDGSHFPAEISLSPFVLDGREVTLAIIRDVSERIRLQALDQEVRLARQVQQHLFPDRAPVAAGFEIAGRTEQANATGGDYYDYLPVQGGLALAVGDVSGHGLGPALRMATAHAYLRVLVNSYDHVEDVLAALNLNLLDDSGPEGFVTLLLGKLNCRDRVFGYASAGHATGYVLDGQGRVKAELTSTGPVLGAFAEVEYSASPGVPLAGGDVICLMTDGIVEARDAQEDMLGPARALEILRACRLLPAREMVDVLIRSAREFQAGPQQDDMTAVVVKVQ